MYKISKNKEMTKTIGIKVTEKTFNAIHEYCFKKGIGKGVLFRETLKEKHPELFE
jgi:hypothetical protein